MLQVMCLGERRKSCAFSLSGSSGVHAPYSHRLRTHISIIASSLASLSAPRKCSAHLRYVRVIGVLIVPFDPSFNPWSLIIHPFSFSYYPHTGAIDGAYTCTTILFFLFLLCNSHELHQVTNYMGIVNLGVDSPSSHGIAR